MSSEPRPGPGSRRLFRLWNLDIEGHVALLPLGALLCVSTQILVPLASDAQGRWSVTIPAPATWAGATFALQTIWVNNVSCPNSSPLSSSATLTIQF